MRFEIAGALGDPLVSYLMLSNRSVTAGKPSQPAPFVPWLWAQVERDRAEARERFRQETFARVKEEVRHCLSRRPSVAAYIFGSLVRPGCFAPASDIDIAVEGLPPADYFSLFGELEDCLRTERLDLIELERCSFADLIRQTGQRIQ